MQTLETNAVIVPEGYFLSAVTLTAAGRQKVTDAFEYHCRGGWVLEQNPAAINDFFFADKYNSGCGTAADWIDDIESDAYTSESHPVCKIEGQIVELVQGIDYFFEFKSWQVWELERIAKGLNDVHEVMQEEMQRLGW